MPLEEKKLPGNKIDTFLLVHLRVQRKLGLKMSDEKMPHKGEREVPKVTKKVSRIIKMTPNYQIKMNSKNLRRNLLQSNELGIGDNNTPSYRAKSEVNCKMLQTTFTSF